MPETWVEALWLVPHVLANESNSYSINCIYPGYLCSFKQGLATMTPVTMSHLTHSFSYFR
jgi:hypothetical protein